MNQKNRCNNVIFSFKLSNFNLLRKILITKKGFLIEVTLQ